MINKLPVAALWIVVVISPTICTGALDVFNVNQTPTVFNFRRDAYISERPEDGVRFSFIASTSDSVAIIVDTTATFPSCSKTLEFYGTDVNFTTPINSSNNTITLIHPLKPVSGSTYYFRALGQSPYNQDFKVHIASRCTLTVAINGSGTAIPPPGTSFIWTNLKTALQAIPSTIAYFRRWTVSGSATLIDSLAKVTSLNAIATQVSATAYFIAKPIDTIDFVRDTFNFKIQGAFNGAEPFTGRLFRFIAPRADSFYITLADADPAVNPGFRWTFYRKDSTFSALDSVSSTTTSIGFRAAASGDNLYFRIKPNPLMDSAFFSAKADSFYLLTVLPNAKDSVTTAGIFWMKKGETKTVSLTHSDILYAFKWRVSAGTARITDTLAPSTSVTIDSSDATVEAVVGKKTVYPITTDSSKFRYDTCGHYASGGVLLSFTAPNADSFYLEVRKAPSHSSTVYYYGTDSTFTTVLASSSVTTANSISFKSLATGAKLFFRVIPVSASYNYYQFTAQIYTFKTLTIQKDLGGTVTVDTSMTVRAGVSIPIDTTFNSYRYFFSKWTVVSGGAAIADTNASSTTIVLQDNTVIRAVYPVRPIKAIASLWDTIGYRDSTGWTKGGILFTFTAPAADSFEIEISYVNRHSMSISCYDTVARCSTATISNSGYYSPTVPRILPVPASAAGLVYYVRVMPTSVTDTLDSMRIRYYQYHTLAVMKDLAGDTTTFSRKEIRSDDSTEIDTPTVPGRFYFDHWTVSTGTATVADSTRLATTILVKSDVLVKVIYKERPITAVGYIWDTIAYRSVEGGTKGGVLLSFTGPAIPDTFLIEIEDMVSHSKRFYYYGGVARCSTEVWGTTGSGTIACAFRTTEPNQTHYFRVEPTTLRDTTDSIRVRMYRFCTVILTSTNGGYAAPDTSIIIENGTLPIQAYNDPFYYFDRWRITSGHAIITDSLSASTNLQVDSVPVTVQAIFNPKTLYRITDYDSTYSFGTHGGKAGSGGVIFEFSPPRTDSFAIVVSPVTSSYNYLFNYGTEDNSTALIDSLSGLSFYKIVNATEEVKQYFRVAPVDPWYDFNNYSFTIRYEDIHYLTFSTTAGGMVKPSGMVAVPDSCFPVNDTALPTSAIYYLDRWVATGNVAYFNGTDSSYEIISVAPVHGNASLQAQFLPKAIHLLANIDSLFSYSIHGPPKGGVLFGYTVAKADSFALKVTIPTAYYYNIDFFDTAASFDSVRASTGNIVANGTFKFLSHGAGTYYFRVNTYNRSDYTQTFLARIDTTVLLRMYNNGNGTTTPSDSLRFLKNGTVTISATPKSMKYRFKVWRIIAGNPNIADTNASSTTVTLASEAQIMAIFEEKPIWPISYTPDTLTYLTHGAPINSGGILMTFVAPRADSFVVRFLPAGPSNSVNIYYYDTASSFAAPRDSLKGAAETAMFGFRARWANANYYFRIEPYSSSAYTDSIGVRVLGFTRVEIRDGGKGTTTPSGTIQVLQLTAKNLSAAPACSLYQFFKWSILKGAGASIADTLKAATTFIVDTAEVIIEANFTAYTVNIIPRKPQRTLYRYTTASPYGYFGKFISGKTDSFFLYVKNASSLVSRTVVYYGTDNRCCTEVARKSVSAGGDTLFRFKALAAGTDHFFRITPSGGSYNDSIYVMWIPFRTLRVTSDGGGKVTPLAPISKPAGDTVWITEKPINELYTFKKWVAFPGCAGIFDTLSPSTWVRLCDSADGTVTATYYVKPHDTLFIEDDTNGITVPMVKALVDTAKDTLIAAYPNSRWLFDHWEIKSGNPKVTDTTKTTMRVKLHGNARVKAHFKPDPDAKPSLVINSVDIDEHPVVEVTATLRERTGKAVSGTDSITFLLMQDTTSPPFVATNISGKYGISVSIVIDRSETMGENYRIDTALAAAGTFIDAMGTLDRAALVSFSDAAYVEQAVTGNKNLLHNVLTNIIPRGQTAIIDGAYKGVEQLINETNTRAVIIFSDGFENASTKNLDSTIAYARRNNVTIYCIAVGPEAFTLVDATLRPLADRTDGFFFFARSTSELTELYQRIKADIESRYLIRYVSPDTVFDGDTHTVVLATELSGIPVRDTGYWAENCKPPEINLTSATANLNATMQSSKKSLSISVTVTDAADQIVPVRKLSYRTAGTNNPYLAVDMAFASGTTYTATVPGDSVIKPGLQYSIHAANSCGGTDNKGPYRINVDNSGPVILHTPPQPPLRAYQDLKLSAVASDTDSVTVVIIQYRTATAAEFSVDTMQRESGDTFTVTIDGKNVFSAYIEYYIEALDSYDALSRNPLITNYKVNIDQPPQIVYIGTTQFSEGDSIYGRVRAVDPENKPVRLALVSTPPSGAYVDSISPSERVIRWKTGPGSNGDYGFVFTASDQSYTVRDTIVILIGDINFPPGHNAPDNLSATEGATVELKIAGWDPDGKLVQFTSVVVPTGAQFKDNGNDTAVFKWSTGKLDAGVHLLVFTLTDGVNVVRDTVNVSIVDSSFYVPVLHATTVDTIIPTGKTVAISIWATDEDRTIPSLSVTGLPVSATFVKDSDGDSGVFTWVTSAQNDVVLTAIAFDRIGANQSDTLTIRLKMAQYLAVAALEDTNANGYFDRVFFTWNGDARLNDSLPHPGEWIDTMRIKTFNDDWMALDPIRLDFVDSMHLSVPLNEKTTALQTGYVKDSAIVAVNGYAVTRKKLPTLVNEVQDRAGPVIKGAFYFPGAQEVQKPRRLVVHFSEPVLWQQVESRPRDFLNYYRNGTLDTMTFISFPAANARFPDSVEMVLPYDVSMSVGSDSLSLKPVASDNRSHIVDSTGWRTLPDPKNRRVPLMLGGDTIYVTAEVYDTNGQGSIDKIDLVIQPVYSFPRTLPPVDSIVRSIAMTPFSSSMSRMLRKTNVVRLVSSNRVSIPIEETQLPTSTETGWSVFSIILVESFISAEGLPFKMHKYQDSVGPVIDNAVVNSSGIGNAGSFDILHVTLSEPVAWKQRPPLPDKLFGFFTGSSFQRGNPFDGLSSRSLRSYDSLNVEIVMDNGFTFSEGTDSLNINVDAKKRTGELTDRFEVNPHFKNRKVGVLLKVVSDAIACPNPFVPGVSKDPTSGKMGTLLIVQCERNAREYEGALTIFNVLGTVVLSEKRMAVYPGNDHWLTYLWNGKDDTKCNVGRGVYLARMILKNRQTGEKVNEFRTKVGVMREPK